jgi:hypothetical protein
VVSFYVNVFSSFCRLWRLRSTPQIIVELSQSSMKRVKSFCAHCTCTSKHAASSNILRGCQVLLQAYTTGSRSPGLAADAFVKKGNFCKPQPGMRSAGVIWAFGFDGFRHRMFGSLTGPLSNLGGSNLFFCQVLPCCRHVYNYHQGDWMKPRVHQSIVREQGLALLLWHSSPQIFIFSESTSFHQSQHE